MKKNLSSIVAIILVVSLFAIVGAKAYDAFQGVTMNNVTFENAFFGMTSGDKMAGDVFGADGDSNFTNLVAEGDITAGGDLTVSGVFNAGGSYYATSSTASAYTILPSEIDDVYLIEWNAGLNTTLTLPATTTTGFDSIVGTAAGSNREYMIYSATTTAATTITIAAGTGIDLQEDEGETVIINGLEVARLMLVRKSNSDVIAWLEVGQVGD